MRTATWLAVGGMAAGLALGSGPPGPAAAATFDGSPPLICAITGLSSCRADLDCRLETPASLNVPRLLRIDVKGKTLSGTRPDGNVGTTPIQFEAHEAGRMFLGGVDGALSWHIDVVEASGDMLVAATGTPADGPFTVGGFGACLVP